MNNLAPFFFATYSFQVHLASNVKRVRRQSRCFRCTFTSNQAPHAAEKKKKTQPHMYQPEQQSLNVYWSQTERTWPFYWTPIHSQGEGQGPAGPSNEPQVPAARWQRQVVPDRSVNGHINSLAMDVRGQERLRLQCLLNVSGR